ncbi:unnamed protein product, partial [marine sediment metagenome]
FGGYPQDKGITIRGTGAPAPGTPWADISVSK